MTAIAPKTYTIEEYTNLSDKRWYELVRGELVELEIQGSQHGLISSKILLRLGSFVEANNLGQTYVPTAFILDNADPDKATVRIPDIAFLQANRVPPIALAGPVPVPPDLAVEVVPPTDVWSKVDSKIDEYLKAGVPLVWVVRTARNVVEVYHPGDLKPTILSINDELNGESVVPGFKLKVDELFK